MRAYQAQCATTRQAQRHIMHDSCRSNYSTNVGFQCDQLFGLGRGRTLGVLGADSSDDETRELRKAEDALAITRKV